MFRPQTPTTAAGVGAAVSVASRVTPQAHTANLYEAQVQANAAHAAAAFESMRRQGYPNHMQQQQTSSEYVVPPTQLYPHIYGDTRQYMYPRSW